MRRNVFGILMIMAVLASSGLTSQGDVEGEMGTGAFQLYRSHQPELPVSFEYPSGWQTEESSGHTEAYHQVQVYGPAALDDRMRTYLVVRAIPTKVYGGRYETLSDMVNQYLASLMPGMRVEREERTTLVGTSTHRLILSGHLLLPWESSRPNKVPIQGERLFLERAGQLFEIGWMATPEASPSVSAAFAHLLDTLSLPQ